MTTTYIPKSVTMQFSNETDTVEVRDMAIEIASGLGFDKIACAEVSLAISEIVGNAIRYAYSGSAIIRSTGNNKSLEIIVQDTGTGIKSIKKAMQEGFSTKVASFGVGLNAASRAMDEFSIKSKNGHGIKVTMKKYLPIPEEEIEYGILSLNDERYPVNGDAYVIIEFDGDKVLLSVIDGIGNGFNANKVANFVKEIVKENYRSGLKTIANRCHKKLRKRFHPSLIRSCVIGLLLLKPRSLEYLGVGDTTVDVMGVPEKINLRSQKGMVGDIRLPNLKLQKFRCKREIILIMCSDGVSHRFTEDELPLDAHAQQIANYIMKNYIRNFGDATVLVVKRKR